MEGVSQYILLSLFCLTLALSILYFLYSRKKKSELSTLLQKERKEANISLLKIQSESLEINKNFEFQKKVISILIHDLRSPLFFIQRVAKNLKNTSDLDEEQLRSIFGALHESTTNITVFITDILYWMHLNEGSVIIKALPFNEFIKPHCELYMGIVNEKKLTVDIKSAPSFIIHADPNYLGIIIRNMFDNAIKHTEKGGISIDAHIADNMQSIIIRDTGKGMSLERAFELEKGIITRKATDNTQIGFRIVYDLVKKMSGTIRVTSSSEGTVITVKLPSFASTDNA